jgi:hypothetical protein
MLIKVKDEKWATAVETALSARVLKTFLVADPHDAGLLSQLCNQAKMYGC